MSTYVLVHGSWHAAWCWYKVVPRLRRRGHKVVALDLPGHGRRWEAPGQVTMDDYVDTVRAALVESSEPVILVGHSRGGIVISQVAETAPEKVKCLVYLAAFLVPNGQAMLALALADEQSLIVRNLTVNEAGGWHMLRIEAAREALYHDCSGEDVALACSLLTPKPNAPVSTPVRTSDESFGSVRRVYIECSGDRGISPPLQKKMYTEVPCERVISMSTSHSPFFSAPDELVGHLTSL